MSDRQGFGDVQGQGQQAAPVHQTGCGRQLLLRDAAQGQRAQTDEEHQGPGRASAGAGVVVEVRGITPRAHFARLVDGLAALWCSASRLPLGELQADWLAHYLTGEDAVQRAERWLHREGGFAVMVAVWEEAVMISLRAAEPSGSCG
ncbi:hypothetical protein C7C46_29095 [Streptomyces tateyamensis]|uniref:Uncharacterized protein n=1 Tax=Streptomyces tateyamensis TaxID=565073 RepID=A0A2V4N8P7_9ACTN|nr:hypothetical protein [Streptomyces tateyamensis]PYC68430.1 hypothetical protein C7C46_29095 [Streptomyces tateyamensis]